MNDDIRSTIEKSEKVKAYLPVSIFIVLIFLLEAFGLTKATGLLISVFISLMILGVMAAGLREKFEDQSKLKPLQFYMGMLTILFGIIFGIAFLHWYQIWHVNLRWVLFFSFLLIFFVVLFRAVHFIYDMRMSITKKKKK